MKVKTILVRSEEGVENAAREILDFCKSEKIFAFYGQLGAGKTTIIKAMCRWLGAGEAFSSPTFSLVNEYDAGKPVYHIDLYRLNSLAEALDIGIEEYLYSGNYCFIEWPQVIAPVLPEESVQINIDVNQHQERKIIIKK